MKAFLITAISIGAGLLITGSASASGLDVQLKDLRNSFFYLSGENKCAKLVSAEIKKHGRLTHCDPEENHVTCKTKDGAKLFAFETEAACTTSAKNGDPHGVARDE